jgi:hypothetical protein
MASRLVTGACASGERHSIQGLAIMACDHRVITGVESGSEFIAGLGVNPRD